MNKILLTGSTGFIGRSLVSSLLNDKKKVFAIIRKSKKNVKSATRIKKNTKIFLLFYLKKIMN